MASLKSNNLHLSKLAGDDPLFSASESEIRITQFMVNPQPEEGLCHPKHANQSRILPVHCSNIGWTSTVAIANRACVSGAKRSNMELYSGALVLYACQATQSIHQNQGVHGYVSKCCFLSCVIIRVYIGARFLMLSFWAHLYHGPAHDT